MSPECTTTTLESVDEVLRVLLRLQGERWLTRGHSKCYGTLVPSIDRGSLESVARIEKLRLERQSIDRFRSAARFFSSKGEENALVDDIVALMVLRHYGAPTRLLDWSTSPFVATYFAVSKHDECPGEIWGFSYRDYVVEGKKQWKTWLITTTDGSGDDDKFDAKLTAFSVNEPDPWIIAGFYQEGFPRQNAQQGAYTMMARFGVDHATALSKLLVEKSLFQRYVVNANLKDQLRTALREEHGIWYGSLFPDTAGAAEAAGVVFKRR